MESTQNLTDTQHKIWDTFGRYGFAAVFEDNDKKPGLSTPILSATQDLTNGLNLCILLGVV